MFKSAVVGCGAIGPVHAKAYQDCKEIELAAVVDIIPERAEKLGKEYGVPWHTNVRKVLKDKRIDFIDVCTPSGMHADIAIAAARAGKHCICEKPMDVTPQRCDQMIRAFDKAEKIYGGIFQHRFPDDCRKTKAAIDAGRLGRLTLLTCSTPWWRTQGYYDSGDWRGTWKLDGGGAMMNQSIHAVDLLMWLVGPIKRITAKTALLAHEHIEVEDTAVAVCEFENGALGTIQGTTAAYPGSGVRHEIMGTDGTAHLTDDRIDLWRLRDEEKPEGEGTREPAAEGTGAAAGAASDPAALASNIFSRNIDDVARAAREGREPCVSGREAKRAVEVICAIYESARTDAPVELPLKEFHP
ncbi:MAG: Gfo/Idh/MocA family oxidoreductase [Phycisphaerae bacterium]